MDSGEGFKIRLTKALVYTVIGLTVGYILGLGISAELTHRMEKVKESRIQYQGNQGNKPIPLLRSWKLLTEKLAENRTGTDKTKK